MSLLIHLSLRIIAVVTLCLGASIGWVLLDTHRTIDAATSASADRVTRDLQTLYWRELLYRGGSGKERLLPVLNWQTLDVLKVVSPGICVSFALDGAAPNRLCGQVEGVGEPAPDWFAELYNRLFGPVVAEERPLSVRQPRAGTIMALADANTAIREAWERIGVVTRVAGMMAGGIGILIALAIGHALSPARRIIAGLRRLENGDYQGCLPVYRVAEFRQIAGAVNDLAGRLDRTTAERVALTKRLFQVQEEERRALARDLHDEFGQCLTATAALAGAIELRAATERPDLVEDARSITRLVRQMMATLREALARLRSQDLDELGLEASLAQLVGGWNAQKAPASVFHLTLSGDLATVPSGTALSIYRIAQECLTNAARHGKPSDVYLQVERTATSDEHIILTVEDNGGGNVSQINATTGHGILGIRERIAALGGTLSIDAAPQGVRVAAVIPLGSARQELPFAMAPG